MQGNALPATISLLLFVKDFGAHKISVVVVLEQQMHEAIINIIINMVPKIEKINYLNFLVIWNLLS